MSKPKFQSEWEEIDEEYQQLQYCGKHTPPQTTEIWSSDAINNLNLELLSQEDMMRETFSSSGQGISQSADILQIIYSYICRIGFGETHKVYRQKLEELTNLQATCSSSISKQRKSFKDLRHSLTRCAQTCDEKDLELITDIKTQIKEKENVFFDMEAYLPKKNGLYLNLVLGNVNVTLLSNQAKFAYKDEYEKFKLYMTIILMFGAITCLFFLNCRVTDEIFNFLLVWYYCTLTIRESILMSNGSRIKGWWVSHHYVSTFLSGVMLTWPEGTMYQKFRSQFLAFSIYQSFVQFLQYYYQSGCLYRLRALGERNQLDLTVEGFQSWMWRGLTFLLPFLFFGHFWQLYNSVTLFRLAGHEDCKEWQVFMLALTFLVLFLGNFLTTLKVVHQKIQKNQDKMQKND